MTTPTLTSAPAARTVDGGLPGAVGAELGKVRRSLSWTVVLMLPVIMVFAGSFMTAVSGEPLADGWPTLWMRSVVFYGLFPLTIGLAILAALVWRAEHRGGNWNALMSTPVPSWTVVVSKTLAVAILGAAMQLVLALTVSATGMLLFGLPGPLPARYWAVTGLLMIAGLPVAAVQSALSMAIRSFAVPIGIALVGAGIAAVLLVAEVPGVIFVWPYAVTARTTQLATGTFGDDGVLSGVAVAAIVASSVLLTALVTALTTRRLDRGDVR